MYCKKLSTSETLMRSPASASQHLVNIPHISAVAPDSAFPLRIDGRSPSAILDLTSAALSRSKNNTPVSIYVWSIATAGGGALRTHLGGNKPKGEYVRLFGIFAVLENLWRYPRRTVGAALGATRSQLPVGEADVRDAGPTGSIYKDTLLYQYHEDRATSCGIWRR